VHVEVGRGHRPREVEALAEWAAEGLEHLEVLGRLHALGDDLQVHRAGHLHDRRGHFGLLRAGLQACDELAVELELVERQAGEVRERRVARAEVVEREADAQVLELAQRLQGALAAAEQRALRDLERQRARLEAGLGDR
jgi:hypothetical protein